MITRTSTILLEGLKDLSSRAAWDEFDARYRPLLLKVARRLGLGPADADDAAQDALAAFIVEYQAGRYNRQAGRLRDWLAGIMTHKVRDVQRRLHRQRTVNADTEAFPLEQIEDDSVQQAVEAEWAETVLVQALDAVRREVAPRMYESFDLVALKQWPAKRVADRLGISMDLVYQNKRRVLQRIRQLLPQIEDEW